MISPELVRGLQERAARAQPPEHVEIVEGWWLRHAASRSWWVGTVLPHGDVHPGHLVRMITRAEGFYAGYGGAAGFQISPPACPEGLDAALAEHGYRRRSEVSLQVASTARVLGQALAGALRLRVDDRPTPEWFEVWHAVHGGEDDPGVERRMLERVHLPSAYADAMIDDEVVAVGRAVADTGWAGVFGMATLPPARGRGAAHGVLVALAQWAHAYGADRMYLQVECDNSPAFHLYERTGFSELSRYHYRTAV